jgi:hypothetical protein
MTQKTGPIKPKYKCEFVASYENNTRRLILLDEPMRTHDETTTVDGVQAIEQFFMENSSNIKAEVNANETHILKLISFDLNDYSDLYLYTFLFSSRTEKKTLLFCCLPKEN